MGVILSTLTTSPLLVSTVLGLYIFPYWLPAPHPPHTHPLPTYLTEQELGEVEENADSEEEDEDDSQWEDATSITSAYTVSSEEAATDAAASAGSELASSA